LATEPPPFDYEAPTRKREFFRLRCLLADATAFSPSSSSSDYWTHPSPDARLTLDQSLNGNLAIDLHFLRPSAMSASSCGRSIVC
jgi:hypothetical protein